MSQGEQKCGCGRPESQCETHELTLLAGAKKYRLRFDKLAARLFEHQYRELYRDEAVPRKVKSLYPGLYAECGVMLQELEKGPERGFVNLPCPPLTELEIALWALGHHHSSGHPSLEKIRDEVDAAETLQYVVMVYGVITKALPKLKEAEAVAEGQPAVPLASTGSASG